MVMFALLLALLASTSSFPTSTTPGPILSHCLQSCECYQDPQRRAARLMVKCSNSDDLPPIFPDGTSYLSVIDSRVPALRAQLHPPTLRALRDFECARCGLAEVAVDAFHALPKLKSIDLSDNAIAALSAAHFSQQRHLELLDVTGNEELDCGTFRLEMAVARPGTCVWCGDFVGPCVKTTRGTVASSVAPERPDTVYPPTPSSETGTLSATSEVTLGSYLLVFAVCGALGCALGACLSLAGLSAARRYVERARMRQREPSASARISAEAGVPSR